MIIRETKRAKHDLNFSKESHKEIQNSQIMKLRERENYLKEIRIQLESCIDSYSVKSFNKSNIQKQVDELEKKAAQTNSTRNTQKFYK